MSRFLRILAKDGRVLVRNRPLLAALLLYPFLLALVLGAAFSEPPTRLDLAVVNHDAGGASFEVGGELFSSEDLVERLDAFADVRTFANEDAALATLRQGEADAVLVVPAGFVQQISLIGTAAELRVVVDESDPVRAQVARNAVLGAIDAFAETVIQKKVADVLDLIDLTVEGGTTRVAFTDVQVLGLETSRELLQEVLATLEQGSAEARKVRDVIFFLDFTAGILGNAEDYLRTTAVPIEARTSGIASEDTRLVSVALPGALVLGVFWTGALAASLLVARDVETGVRRRLAAAPTPAWHLAASKVLVALLAALVPALVLLALGLAVLDARVEGPALTLAALLLASLAAAALGGAAAMLARGSSGAALLVVLVLMPMLLLGGLFYPVAYMPDAAQAVARALPVTLATDALRGAMIRGSPFAELAAESAGLVLFAAAAGVAAWALGRRAT